MSRLAPSVVAILAVALSLPGAPAAPAHNRKAIIDTENASGVLRTITLDGKPLDLDNPFFQSLGTNGRACSSCHVPSAGWTITPAGVRERFAATGGLDPIFRTNDGSNSPLADVSTVAARRKAFNMLLGKGLIRVGLPIPKGAEFELANVDDPYGYASAKELSLFRRPLPSTNLRFLTGVMWDGRESFAPLGTAPIRSDATAEENARALFEDLQHQAEGATVTHAQGSPLTAAQLGAIANFELNLATAQAFDRNVGALSGKGARGGPENLAGQNFYVTINDVLGADVVTGKFDPRAMTLYKGWARSADRHRAAVARGEELFNTKKITITGVGGLNDALGLKRIAGTCTSCHDSPNVGNHSTAMPIDIGLTDEAFRAPDMPLYTLKNRATGKLRTTTDPGLALLTGKWADVGKFKGPVLRGLAARAPYFHNGSAANLSEVLDFYESRFEVDFTERERADLIAFLNAL
jgi:cytochrome c peroxidase